MAQINARLFGGFELRDASGAELKLNTRKTRGLLAFLIVEADRWHTRDRLAGLLWSDRQQAQARHSLTQALSAIRKLGEAVGQNLIESDGERVRLLAQAISADALLFREKRESDFTKAAELYSGPLLDDFQNLDPPIDEWLAKERAAFHEQACTALAHAIDHAEARGDLVAGIAIAKRWVALDAYAEPAHRRLMSLLAASGDRPEAIRQYHVCARLLANELGIEPSEETRALLEEIRARADSARTRAVSEAAPSSATPALPLPDRPSIAVLPFDNKSGDPEQEYFADGISEDLITALSRIHQFFVVARNTTFTFKGKAVDVQAVAQDLGVQYVLEGSVRHSSKRLRITVQLVDGRTGNHLWAERYDRDLEDVFAVQDEITQTVVGAIQPELSRAEQERARLKPPENMDAWECYQRGIWHTYQRTRDDLEQAQDHFRRAISLDPNMSQAYAGLVETYFFQVADSNTTNTEHAISEAIAAAQTAVNLDSRDAMAHYALGRAYTIAGRHDEAVPQLQEAIDLNPSLARAYYALGFALVNSGHPKQGIAQLKTAIRLSPHDPTAGQFMVQISRGYLFLNRYEDALKWAREALTRPNIRWTRWTTLISTLGHLDRLEEAAKAIEALHHFKPEVDFDFVEKAEIAVVSHTPSREHVMDGLRKAGFDRSKNE